MDEASTITHQVPPGPSVEGETFIHRIPPETLLHIFAFCLPNSNPESITLEDDAEVEDFIMTTAPYNISRVCRPWRELVISNASLWTKFALSLTNPSPRTLNYAKSIIVLHLERSQDLPMSLSIKLSGTFDADVTRDIASQIALHQKRWKTIELLFKRNPGTPCKGYLTFCDVDDVGNPISEPESNGEPVPIADVASFTCNKYDEPAVVDLFTEELCHLEELTINRASLYGLWETRELQLPKPIPSLRRLSLEIPGRDDKLALWLYLVPNIEELDLSFEFSDPRWYQRNPDAFKIPTIQLDRLWRINISRGFLRANSHVSLATSMKASNFVLRRLTCPSLTELSLRMSGYDCARYLRSFFSRSAPPLTDADLHIASRPFNGVEGETLAVDGIIESFILLPSITKLTFTCRHLHNIGRLIQELRSSTILPSLEHVEFQTSGAQPSLFVELVSSRWSAPERAIKSVVLRNCETVTGRRSSRFPLRGLRDDISQLPEEWVGLRNCIEEGLRFEVF